MRTLGLIILGGWLIATHVVKLANIHFAYDRMIFASLALLAGTALLLHAIKSKLGDIGVFFLSLWLLFRSSVFLFKFNFQYTEMVIEVLGITAGLMLILRK